MRKSCRPRSVLRACLLACLSVCLSVRPPVRPSVSVSARAHALASSLKDLRPAQEHPPRGVGATVRRHSMYVPRVCLPVCEHRNTRHGVPVSAKKRTPSLADSLRLSAGPTPQESKRLGRQSLWLSSSALQTQRQTPASCMIPSEARVSSGAKKSTLCVMTPPYPLDSKLSSPGVHEASMHRGGQRLVGPANFEQRGEGGLERSCLYGGVLFFALTGRR